MNTMDERYEKGWALLREDMAKRETEAVKRDAQRTEREATARWWQTAIAMAASGVATAVILAGIGVAATVIINYLPG